MCGKALPFHPRFHPNLGGSAAHSRRSLVNLGGIPAVSQRLTAHQAAEPQNQAFETCVDTNGSIARLLSNTPTEQEKELHIRLRCNIYFEARENINRFSLRSDLEERSDELRLPRRVPAVQSFDLSFMNHVERFDAF